MTCYKLSAPRKALKTMQTTKKQDAEWVQPGGLLTTFGIKRAMAYVLAERGEIEMISLRPKGAKRGLSLVNVDSVRQFIQRRRDAAQAIAGGVQ